VTDASARLVAVLVEAGLERREARWLVEEFAPGADPDAEPALWAAANRRLAGEPLQYVIGHWPFRGLDLDVDARVLIPRPETEGLVELALAALAVSGAVAPTILDLGCGSGAIGLALLDELRARGVNGSLIAVDESSDALDVVRRNAIKHGLQAVSLVRSSWFADLDPSLAGHLDLVVANPPYVAESELASLDPELGYEPAGALVAPDARGVAGFADLEIILDAASTWLAPGAALVVEHGDHQGDAVVAAAHRAGLVDVADHLDLAGRPRVLTARRAWA
jgi:release factor glutamine methyltransferase